MDFLNIAGKTFLVSGVANKKSVAYAISRILIDAGAKVILSVQTQEAIGVCAKLLPDCPSYVCNVENTDDIRRLSESIATDHPTLHGFVHSIAYANYSGGIRPFHEIPKADFLQAMNISMFSLVEMSGALKPLFASDASVVTISISHTSMAAESYGYMAPIKAALDSSISFLAKSFSAFSTVRFNAINAGLLKTSASAGIPGYLDNYLFAEKTTLRKRALATTEVANLAVFLLSPASSGINAQRHVIDAGMSVNFFDQDIVRKAVKLE